ncbi:winged helix-turn-helix transcriptional regulator [Treponema sp. OMZ 792]|uniref:autorepressor SdpR family transcription factor n=1 Tax=unclassified Treponema TaxID=2638727 RepID=UPI0020A32BDD|nr:MULTISPECIES: autorepressor SdpR family transcription factor [unclassified Treponema]UTC75387.1 winged helix-turn-helix transcriptional regulator [Treponema sp. OMZ 792]UTC78822.1 winged helix-turn-helix transcriptional regulator [Treponema sp. OMZ 799]UTC79390.1 winged helix-turn-helix transcriptional regulator [Treponema sp. OMZ 798]
MSFESTFKALADPVRRDILISLKEKSLTAGEIADKYELSNSTISYHLSLLKKADLISERKYKNFIYYDINISIFEEAIMWLSQFKGDKKND